MIDWLFIKLDKNVPECVTIHIISPSAVAAPSLILASSLDEDTWSAASVPGSVITV